MTKRFTLISIIFLGAVLISFAGNFDRKSFREITVKAKAGDVDALENLAGFYSVGFFVEKDPEKAEELYRTLAERLKPGVAAGNSAHIFRMGRALRALSSFHKKRGDVAKKSALIKEAHDLILRAALLGHGGAQVMISEHYFRGDGVQRDEVEAYAWEMVAIRYLENPHQKMEMERIVANDQQRASAEVWQQAVKRRDELQALIESRK